MYNGIGLQTARGSGTNGYVQTNKFFVRPKTSKVGFDGNKGFGPDQGTAGLSKKPNTEILEHDRKRQIELKLVILEDKLSEEGYTDAEIAEKVDELREKLEAEAAAVAAVPDDSGAMAMSCTNPNYVNPCNLVWNPFCFCINLKKQVNLAREEQIGTNISGIRE